MIEEIRIRRFSLPLREAYKLAFGPVAAFDTILAEVWSDGSWGIGEATLLTGYTDETIDQSHAAICAAAEKVIGLTRSAARDLLLTELAELPFTATAIVSAIEMAEGHPLLQSEETRQVPILAGLNATDEAGIVREMEIAIAAGYRTLKVKVGFHRERDLARVAFIQRVNAGRLRLRIDANQGYDRTDAVAFARSLDPESIELLEQPSDAADWDSAAAVARVTTVPLMLDESIYSFADIDRAAALGAKFVKLKLMKFASLDRLADGLARIRSLGMEAILGNGVASDVGCWMEACVAARHVRTAGEMNGFRRLARPTVADPMPCRDGWVTLAPRYQPRLDETAITGNIVQETIFGKGRQWQRRAAAR